MSQFDDVDELSTSPNPILAAIIVILVAFGIFLLIFGTLQAFSSLQKAQETQQVQQKNVKDSVLNDGKKW
jgi:hypothetical protein